MGGRRMVGEEGRMGGGEGGEDGRMGGGEEGKTGRGEDGRRGDESLVCVANAYM